MDPCQQGTPEQSSAKLMLELDCAIILSLQPNPLPAAWPQALLLAGTCGKGKKKHKMQAEG